MSAPAESRLTHNHVRSAGFAEYVEANRDVLERLRWDIDGFVPDTGRRKRADANEGHTGVVRAFDVPSGVEGPRGLGFLGLGREGTARELAELAIAVTGEVTIHRGKASGTALRSWQRSEAVAASLEQATTEMRRRRRRYGVPGFQKKIDRWRWDLGLAVPESGGAS